VRIPLETNTDSVFNQTLLERIDAGFVNCSVLFHFNHKKSSLVTDSCLAVGLIFTTCSLIIQALRPVSPERAITYPAVRLTRDPRQTVAAK
jgi:hypothetical protein